jgi:hypothetical protein
LRIKHTYALLLVACSTVALAQVQCPQLPLAVQSESEARALAKALQPLAIQDQSGDPCKPKVSGFLAFGKPLCLLSPAVPAIGLAFSFLEGEAKPIAAHYLVEYSEKHHRELEQLMGQRYERVDAVPSLVQRLGVHEELTATFRSGDTLVSLERPSDGMPGQWMSSLAYQREDRIHISRRNWNTCK